MNILILGGDGFIGTGLHANIIRSNPDCNVYTVSRHEVSHNGIGRSIKSLSDVSDVLPQGTHFDSIVNCISSRLPVTITEKTIEVIHSQLELDAMVLNLLNKLNYSQYVFLSSGGAVYGDCKNVPTNETSILDPISHYGFGKALSEAYYRFEFRDKLNKLVIIRPGNIYGFNDKHIVGHGLVQTIIHGAMNGKCIEIYGGNVTRDYLHINDFLSALLAIIDLRLSGTYNVGTGIEISNIDVYNIVSSEMIKRGYTTSCRYHDKRPYDVDKVVLDVSHFKSITQWSPSISFKSGVIELINAFRNQYEQTIT